MAKKVLLLLVALAIAVFFKYGLSYMQSNRGDKLRLTDKYYNSGKFIEVDSDTLNKMGKETYIVYVYNSFCTFKIPCEEIFKNYMEKYKIDFLKININEYRETYLFDKVKYAPSVILVKDKKVIAYLDANKDEDLSKYQNVSKFEKWLNSYIETK